MTKSFHNQFGYTKKFLIAAGLDLDAVEDYRLEIWWNPTAIEHVRLSNFGYSFITKKAKIPFYPIRLLHTITSQNLIDLTRINIGPYYMYKESILLLEEQSASMILLHNGDIGTYLANLKLD